MLKEFYKRYHFETKFDTLLSILISPFILIGFVFLILLTLSVFLVSILFIPVTAIFVCLICANYFLTNPFIVKDIFILSCCLSTALLFLSSFFKS